MIKNEHYSFQVHNSPLLLLKHGVWLACLCCFMLKCALEWRKDPPPPNKSTIWCFFFCFIISLNCIRSSYSNIKHLAPQSKNLCQEGELDGASNNHLCSFLFFLSANYVNFYNPQGWQPSYMLSSNSFFEMKGSAPVLLCK